MADVVTLPGVFRVEAEEAVTPAEVLRHAADAGLRDVVVVGRTIGGEIAVWSSSPDADAALGLMVRGSAWLAACEQVGEGG